MTLFEKNSDEVWLVIDARTANLGISSGISRFVIGLTTALSSELHKKKPRSSSILKKMKILIISKSDPADWMIQLVYHYPNLVCFWKGDSGGFWAKKFDRLTWLWPTRVLKKLETMTHNRVIWFAPANFDRPLFISNKEMAHRVIQVIHDTIPFQKLKGLGFFFRTQFKFLVLRALSKISMVATVSHHSAELLTGLGRKRIHPLYIVSDAVEDVFGNQAKIFAKEELIPQRTQLIEEISTDFNFSYFFSCHWVIGVGRNQKYKSWDVTFQSIEFLNKQENTKKIWFIRVGADNKEVNSYAKKHSFKEFGKIKIFEDLNLVFLPTITDEQLSNLYRLSDLLVHPSLAEGFGLPPLEAALCGLPVLFRKGSSVDEHFAQDALPSNFWNGINSSSPSDWSNEIQSMLADKKNSGFYKGLINSTHPRNYLLAYAKSEKDFKWENSANAVLNIIESSTGLSKLLNTTD